MEHGGKGSKAQRRKWLKCKSPGGTPIETSEENGTVFHRRDVTTPGGAHHYKDEICSKCTRTTKCIICSKRTAGNQHDSRRKNARKLVYSSEGASTERAERYQVCFVLSNCSFKTSNAPLHLRLNYSEKQKGKKKRRTGQ